MRLFPASFVSAGSDGCAALRRSEGDPRLPLGDHQDRVLEGQGRQGASHALLHQVRRPNAVLVQSYFVDDLQEKSLLHYRDLTMQGIPNNHELQWLSWRGPGYAHLFFAPISPSRGKDAETQYELCKQLCRKYEFQYMGNFCA